MDLLISWVGSARGQALGAHARVQRRGRSGGGERIWVFSWFPEPEPESASSSPAGRAEEAGGAGRRGGTLPGRKAGLEPVVGRAGAR